MDTNCLKHKVVFLGPAGAGKTSLIVRLLYNSFDPTYMATIGIDFMSHILLVDGKAVRLQIWDTAGQERFKSLIPSYIRGSRCVFLVYDVTSGSAEEDVKAWHKVVMNEENDPLVVLIGNKIDREDARTIDSERGRNLAEAMGAMYIETSAKTGHNVVTAFKRAARAMMEAPGNPVEMFEKLENVDLNSERGEKGGCLC
jgi:Ras-related protein Rab-6A